MQNMFEQICRWKKQVFIDQEIVLFMLGTNIQNQYGKEMQSTPNLQSLQTKTSKLTARIEVEKEDQSRNYQ